jgi:hypothetical protein
MSAERGAALGVGIGIGVEIGNDLKWGAHCFELISNADPEKEPIG